MTHVCPLCRAPDAEMFADIPPRHYFGCRTCELVFLDPTQRPSAADERAEYDLHRNDPLDFRYRKWLARLINPLIVGFSFDAEGLDFGSGPGPTISAMLSERGYTVTNYDPNYAPDRGVLEGSYDFISCTEVAEHFHAPCEEFALFNRMLRPGGRLGVMTELLLPTQDFAGWRYRLQPSHVVFYRPETMAWIAERFAWSLELQEPDVTLFERLRT